MTATITYRAPRPDSRILNVSVEGRLRGKIKPCIGGYRYEPMGVTMESMMGEVFPTVAAVKASIEGTDEPESPAELVAELAAALREARSNAVHAYLASAGRMGISGTYPDLVERYGAPPHILAMDAVLAKVPA